MSGLTYRGSTVTGVHPRPLPITSIPYPVPMSSRIHTSSAYRRAYSIFNGVMPDAEAHRKARVYSIMGYPLSMGDSEYVRNADRVKYVIPDEWDVAFEEYCSNIPVRMLIDVRASEVHARPLFYLWNHRGEYLAVRKTRLGFEEDY